MAKNKVISHLKKDIGTFKHEAAEDKKLIRALKPKKHHSKKKHEEDEDEERYEEKIRPGIHKAVRKLEKKEHKPKKKKKHNPY